MTVDGGRAVLCASVPEELEEGRVGESILVGLRGLRWVQNKQILIVLWDRRLVMIREARKSTNSAPSM